MTVLSLAVRDFRNIANAELAFSSGLNLFTGDNGAGKTSLLEALYFLGRVQSFRTAQPAQLIRGGTDSLLVTGQLAEPDGGTIAVGVERSRTAARVRLAGHPVSGLAELLAHFPFQVLTPDSHELLNGGPRARRRYLDWGVFHVEPGFLPAWRRFGRAVRQRNAALRSQVSLAELRLWDRELAATAELLDRQRAAYIAEL
ncbi:MAG: DNA replication and repair protein RecF, partial [Thiohalobacteraceae bacterium]